MIDFKFTQTTETEFKRTLKKSVNEYFAKNGIDKKANHLMISKTLIAFSFYSIVYFFILSGIISNLWFLFTLWAMLGLGQSFVGMSVMHDKVHGAYTKNKTLSLLLEIPITLIGLESRIWAIEHNIIHHTFTNVNGIDQDIHPRYLFRFSMHQPKRWFHRFQHLYASFLYGLLTIEWVTYKDFVKVLKYYQLGFIKTSWEATLQAFLILIKKMIFFVVFLLIPLWIMPYPAYLITLMFLTMVVVSGISMTIVFQLAHVVDNVDFADSKEQEPIDWYLHQMSTTANFATNNKVITYFLGGLNFQIEHHLFPDICHVHYPAISKIVESTAKEYSYPYIVNETFMDAINKHFRLLKNLGK